MVYPVCSEDGEVEAVLEFVRKKGNNFSDYDTEVNLDKLIRMGCFFNLTLNIILYINLSHS